MKSLLQSYIESPAESSGQKCHFLFWEKFGKWNEFAGNLHEYIDNQRKMNNQRKKFFCGSRRPFWKFFVSLPSKFFTMKRFFLFLILMGMFLHSITMAQTTIRQKDQWGTKLYYVDGQTLKQKDQWGEKLAYFDGKTVRHKDQWGEKLLYIDGNVVRHKDQWGEKLLYFDGNKIRQKDQWGIVLYYIDGQYIRQKDQWGDKLYYFDGLPEKWVLACLVL